MIKVSACIVTHNNVKYIEKAVRTLLDSVKTDNIDFRLYVIDNASTDGTVELLIAKFCDRSNFELIENDKNIGFGAAHNQMIEIINGEFKSNYHCVVNPDVEIRDDILDIMVSYMEEEEQSDVVQLSPRICFPETGKDQILGKRNPHFIYLVSSRLRGKKPSWLLSRYAMLDADYSKPFEIWNATGCFMFFRTEAFLRLNGFDERYFMYFEDCDITREMKKLGRVLFFPHAIVYHVWARDSKRDANLKKIHIQSMFKYYLKWRTI
ncbi:MAG: glycosyltransferase family 2 protein [Ruminococcaceae bacterium]|nr:glycosyltransferase family 2 protein [Oscillospiraceae bacterium]